MKKTIILLFGMLLLLNGVDFKSSENNNSNKSGKLIKEVKNTFGSSSRTKNSKLLR
jgi:hypothetical protein